METTGIIPGAEIFKTIKDRLVENGFEIIASDSERPWGGFFVINEAQSEKFMASFFPEKNFSDFTGKVSPKVLIVMPGKRLSWQYHFRRAELWKVVEGEVGVITSDNDNENPMARYFPGSVITLKKGERHRLVGLDTCGIIAEIWQHTENGHPSDEEDIVRLQDDYGR
jgi:mannose-6-phosphate isomerase-like protein (cupin superfamily)